MWIRRRNVWQWNATLRLRRVHCNWIPSSSASFHSPLAPGLNDNALELQQTCSLKVPNACRSHPFVSISASACPSSGTDSRFVLCGQNSDRLSGYRGGAFSGGSKQLGRPGHRWPLSSAEVKNQWNRDYSPMCLHAVHRDSLTFSFMLQQCMLCCPTHCALPRCISSNDVMFTGLVW